MLSKLAGWSCSRSVTQNTTAWSDPAPFVMAVPPNCDPFESYQRSNRSTCSGSTLEYYANGTVLTLTASLADCASTTSGSVSSVSVFFDEVITPKYQQGADRWTLSYSIMWTEPSTNCVVDVAAPGFPLESYSLLNDTNGLSNNPMENITQYALNQWYTRSFIISGSNLSEFRFGFTCASMTPVTGTKQVAFVKNIDWKFQLSNRSIYNSLRSCIDCVDPPLAGSDCTQVDGTNRWVYNGNINADALELVEPLIVIGNITTGKLTVHKRLDIRGCLIHKPQYQGDYTMLITAFRDSPVVISLQAPENSTCKWPRWDVIFSSERAFPLDDENLQCTGNSNFRMDRSINGTFVTTMTNNTLSIYAPDSIWGCLTYEDYYAPFVVAIVIPVVAGTAGIIIGIVLGVRRCKQQRRAKEVEMDTKEQIQRIDSTKQCASGFTRLREE